MSKMPWISMAAMIALTSGAQAQNPPPPSVMPDTVEVTEYDGSIDDLLTGGLGASVLGAGPAPGFADANAPTAAELRRLAIFNNYRALVDVAPGGGYGVLFGPQVDAGYRNTGGTGKVAGREYIAYATEGPGRHPVTVMAQIPDGFDVARPCVITAPSSGSRGIYGAISLAEWGLVRGCAVAFTDKGTGNGFHDLTGDTALDMRGRVVDPDARGARPLFRAERTPAVAVFRASKPGRIAYKHAHSRMNPEADWGGHVLMSIEFALWALNDAYGAGRFTPTNTTVIASGVSNGGGAAIRAAEQDARGLVDGVVASEPNVQPRADGRVTVHYDGVSFAGPFRSGLDWFSFMDVYAACAALDASLADTPLQALEPFGVPAGAFPARANRCQSLRDLGLLTADGEPAQAAEALRIVNSGGFLREANVVLAAHDWLGLWRSLAPTYANAYLRASVSRNLCGLSHAATDPATGRPRALPPDKLASIFSAGSGIVPTNGVDNVADSAANGPVLEQLARSRRTGRQDLNAESALCLRQLATGEPVRGRPFAAGWRLESARARAGAEAVRASANLGGRPAIVLHGRNDGLLPVNFTSRPYLGLNSRVEGAASGLRYAEVDNAQHFDAFNSTSFAAQGGALFVPLHYYMSRALDAMLAHLRDGAPLPGSQVVRTTPRGTTPLTTENFRTFMPDLAAVPEAASAIAASNGIVQIPR